MSNALLRLGEGGKGGRSFKLITVKLPLAFRTSGSFPGTAKVNRTFGFAMA
jgi:hypothetical protein